MINQNNQKSIWQREHTSKSEHFLPGHAGSDVTEDVRYFCEFIKRRDKNYINKKVIDIGAGKGRNALYFLEQGFEVYATDFIQEALDELMSRAKLSGLDKNLKIVNCEINNKWPFSDNFFDYGIDSLSSIDIDGYDERCKFRDELMRTLKKGGISLFRTVSVNDEFETELMKKHPGNEKNSSIWPESNKFQKNYSYAEIRDFYKDFHILEITEYVKQAVKINKKIEATNFRVILEKP